MNRRTIFALSLAVASAFTSEAVFAAPAAIHSPVHAMFAKSKLVKFSLRNDGAAPLTLKAGDETITLEAGKTKDVELAVGTRITRQEATGTEQAGTVIAEVSKQLSGTTIALKN